ncbi:methyl-accepting chemotaxis protein [Halanaerobacter jeridensis]|uniref:Methyl-accepting chemotaxis protein n=1 Tax=Halanaerobacter jeridensis TaxID=706427 RepID=A0A938XQJ1_9FIRM|nr:HAMP domain-containing methyl-accepting chemotaxis protein [Halanaerobacter jeridensis]MBM7555490.1 methyl-accepting chemotaxis protein [Halanaerobacter jeridensis]
MKISKLLKIVASVTLVLLVLVGSSVYYLNISFRQERRAVSRSEKLRTLGREMLATVNELSSLVYKYVQTSDKKYSNKYLKIINETKKREEILKKFKAADIPQEELDLIHEAVNKSERIIRYEKGAIAAVDSGNISAAKRKLYNSYYSRRKESFKETLNEFQIKLKQRTENIKESAQRQATFSLSMTGFLILIVAIVIVVTFIVLYNTITTPINKAVEFADEIANGNLNSSPLEVQGRGEIAELSRSLNQMKNNLKKTITRILDLNKDLSSYRSDINEVDKKVTNAFDFIKDVEQGNEETATAVDEISLSIKEIAKGTEKLSIKAEDISDLEEETFKLVKETHDKINSGTELVSDAVNIMEELDRSVSKVDKISEEMMTIADETNLLSLDGAIELADSSIENSSHGFASVADDIKDLADESMESAKEVKGIVQEVKQVTNLAINIMISSDESNQNIEDVFREIQNLSNALLTKVEKVTSVTEEQVASTEEISASTEEISAASEEVSSRADEMYENAQNLKGIISQVVEVNKKLQKEFKAQAKKSEKQLEEINLES